jgi:hypothetical protein
MTVDLRGVPTVNLAGFLRALHRGPQNPRARALARAIETELRVRAFAATTPGIGRPHGAAFRARVAPEPTDSRAAPSADGVD